MTISQIQHFIEVAASGSFANASEKLFITQSGLSYSIRQLEKELSVPLFNRVGNILSLTTYGAAFLPYAQKILAELEQARGSLTAITKDSQKDNLDLAYIGSLGKSLIPKVMTDFFIEGHSEINLNLKPFRSFKDLFACFEHDEADAVVYYTKPNNAYSCEIAQQELLLVMPKSHPLAGKSLISLRELKQAPMCFPLEGSHLYTHTIKMFSHEHILPNIQHQTSEWRSMVTLASLGKYLCVVPAGLFENSDVSFAHIDSPLNFRGIYLSVSRSAYQRSETARQFFDFCQERYASSR